MKGDPMSEEEKEELLYAPPEAEAEAEDYGEDDPGSCSVCGKDYEIVRPGKSQPTCDCHMRCPCGRMKVYYAIGEHPTEPKAGGYLCPSCGMMGPCDEVLKKSLVRSPVEEGDEHRARLLTYVQLGRVKLPIPFGHGFFFDPKTGKLMFSPWAMHAMRLTWSMDSDFPIEVPEEVDLSGEMGIWTMISAVVMAALDGHPEASKWQVVYEFATAIENKKLGQMKKTLSEQFSLWVLVTKQKQELMRKLLTLRPDLTLSQIRSASKSPWVVGKYDLEACLKLQTELIGMGAFTQITRA